MVILIFIVILGLLVFVHEFGHFSVARLSGVAVEEFGFGFPPRLFGWRRGGTIFSLNLIPFGGFVRLQGEQGDQAKRSDSFSQARYSHQFAVMSAGVVMNVILAWFLLTLALVIGVKTDSASIPTQSFVQRDQPQVEATVSKDSAAAAAGLKTGDVITAVNGLPLTSTEEIINLIKSKQYPPLVIDFLRGQVSKQIKILPRAESTSPRYGLGIQSVTTVRYPWYVAPWYGLKSVLNLIGQTIAGFWHLVHDLILTASVNPDLTGPVGIAVLTGQVVQFGFSATLQFMAILSISLAVVNFLPLPALDGGRAVFLTIARLRGRPINTHLEGAIHTVGFYLLLSLVILLSIRDVSRFHLFAQLRTLFR